MAFTDYEKFVETWQSCDSQADVMKILKLKKHQVETIAHKLRKLGVKLKPYAKNPKFTIDRARISELNKICKEK